MNSARFGRLVSASKNAWRSSWVSASLRAVMSREIPNVPMMAPLRSRSGILVVDTQRTPPSGLVSFSSRPTRGPPVRRILLVPQRLRGMVLGEVVEVRPSHGEGRVGEPEAFRRVPVDAGETAVAVLEVDAVWNVVHQRLEQKIHPFLEAPDVGACLVRSFTVRVRPPAHEV